MYKEIWYLLSMKYYLPIKEWNPVILKNIYEMEYVILNDIRQA